MNKNVQIVKTITGMSQSLDAIASNVTSGAYSTDDLHQALGSVANVLETTASAENYILGQVSDVDTFTSVASTTDFDDTYSVVLATKAQATLVGQMIEGELGITAEDEDDIDDIDDEEKATDEVQESVSFDEDDYTEVTAGPNVGRQSIPDAAKLKSGVKSNKTGKVSSLNVKKGHAVKPTKVMKATSLEAQAQELLADGFTVEAGELMAIAKKLGTGVNHGEINSDLKVTEKSGANEIIEQGRDTNPPSVKTVANATAMSSEASSQPLVSWNFN